MKAELERVTAEQTNIKPRKELLVLLNQSLLDLEKSKQSEVKVAT